MENILTQTTITNEPREISHTIMMKKFHPFPFLRNVMVEINWKIPNPSIRQSQKLSDAYIQIVSKIDSDPENMVRYIAGFVVVALEKSTYPISPEWIEQYLSEEALAQIYEFLSQPIQARIEDQIKNRQALQALGKRR
jgi:hypothetical protein